MKIRVTPQLWGASTVIVGVLVILVEGHVQQREVRPM